MEVIIDCSLLLDDEDFYTQLMKQVDFGEFFGRNLDAFWDYIGLLYEKKIIFLNYGSLSNDMILFVNKIINLINENNTEHKGIDKRHLISIEILF